MKHKTISQTILTLVALVFFGCSMPETPPVDTVVSIATLHGVTAPIYGATPVSTITETSQFVGAVAWSGDPAAFAASAEYTATITLSPKAGYTLDGVTANYFTVSNAISVENLADSGIVTALFAPTRGDSYTSTHIGGLAYIPAGRFQRDETPDNISVITKPYRISQREITREQFSAIMGSDPSQSAFSNSANDPVHGVNWYHAIAFCNKLSLAEGLAPVYTVTGVSFEGLNYDSIPLNDDENWNKATAIWTNDGYRLPTEMEWMWAAIGAPLDGQGNRTNTTGYSKAFAGSDGNNVIDEYSWYSGNSNGKTHISGSKKPNDLGLYDMSGNVSEWIWDTFRSYPSGVLVDYQGFESRLYEQHILRGGSWYGNAFGCKVSTRGGLDSQVGYDYRDIGFRVVRP